MRHSSASYAREQLEQKRRDRERAIALSTEAERRERIEHEKLAQEAIDFRWRALHMRKQETQQKYRDESMSLSSALNLGDEAHVGAAEFTTDQAEVMEALRTEEQDLKETQHKLDEERRKGNNGSKEVRFQIKTQNFQGSDAEIHLPKHREEIGNYGKGVENTEDVIPYKEEQKYHEAVQYYKEDGQSPEEEISRDHEDAQNRQEDIRTELEEGRTLQTEVQNNQEKSRQLAERLRIKGALWQNHRSLEAQRQQKQQDQQQERERRSRSRDELLVGLRAQEWQFQKPQDQKQRLQERPEDHRREDEGLESEGPGLECPEGEREDKRVESEYRDAKSIEHLQPNDNDHKTEHMREEWRSRGDEYYLDRTWQDKGLHCKQVEDLWAHKPRKVNIEKAKEIQQSERPVENTQLEAADDKKNKEKCENFNETPAFKANMDGVSGAEELLRNKEFQKDEAAAAKGKAEQESAGPSLQSLQRELDLMRDEARHQWLPSFLIQNTTSLPLHIGMFAYQKLPPALLNFQNNVQPGGTVKLTAPTFAGIYTLDFYIACGAESAFRRRALVLSSVTGPVERVTNYFVKYKASTFSTEAGRDLSRRQDQMYTLLRKAETRRNVPLFTSSGWFLKGTRFLRFSGGPEMFHDDGRMVLRVTKNSQRFNITEMDSFTALAAR